MSRMQIDKPLLAGLTVATFLIAAGCNLPFTIAGGQVETQLASTVQAAQEATETARALGD